LCRSSVCLLILNRYSTERANFEHESVDLQYYGLGFGIRGLGVRESGLDQDPYQEKYIFTSITRVPVIKTAHVKARLKSLSARIVLSLRLVVTCARGLIPDRPKSHIPSIAHYATIIHEFHADGEESQF
jgi:hypothetical protein